MVTNAGNALKLEELDMEKIQILEEKMGIKQALVKELVDNAILPEIVREMNNANDVYIAVNANDRIMNKTKKLYWLMWYYYIETARVVRTKLIERN